MPNQRAPEGDRAAQEPHQQVHRRGQEAAQAEEQHREEGGATEVHAEPATAWAVRDAAGRGHLPGELDRRLRISGAGKVSIVLGISNRIVTILVFGMNVMDEFRGELYSVQCGNKVQKTAKWFQKPHGSLTCLFCPNISAARHNILVDFLDKHVDFLSNLRRIF